ncbi:MAG: hypothetical protein ABI763_15005 [Bacteroidota bacterium]
MKKSIIALQGDQNSGKSITIGLLFHMMRKNGFQTIKDKARKNSKDFFVILKKNDILIGVSSYGDTEYWIKDRCGKFVIAGCQIMVCACHKEGKTVEAVLSFTEYELVFFAKNFAMSSEQLNANTADAEELLGLVEDLLKNENAMPTLAPLQIGA